MLTRVGSLLQVVVGSNINKLSGCFHGSRGSGNGQFQYPYGLGLSNCGQYLFVCDYNNHRIQLFNAMNGEFVKSYGSKSSNDAQFDRPFGICISPSGKIIVSESGYSNDQHRVQIFE